MYSQKKGWLPTDEGRVLQINIQIWYIFMCAQFRVLYSLICGLLEKLPFVLVLKQIERKNKNAWIFPFFRVKIVRVDVDNMQRVKSREAPVSCQKCRLSRWHTSHHHNFNFYFYMYARILVITYKNIILGIMYYACINSKQVETSMLLLWLFSHLREHRWCDIEYKFWYGIIFCSFA